MDVILKDLRLSFQRFKWTNKEEIGFRGFHDKVNLPIIRISIVSFIILLFYYMMLSMTPIIL